MLCGDRCGYGLRGGWVSVRIGSGEIEAQGSASPTVRLARFCRAVSGLMQRSGEARCRPDGHCGDVVVHSALR